MELRRGKIVGHKRVTPSDFKIIQGPFGRPIKMFKKRAGGGARSGSAKSATLGSGGAGAESEAAHTAIPTENIALDR